MDIPSCLTFHWNVHFFAMTYFLLIFCYFVLFCASSQGLQDFKTVYKTMLR